MHEQGHGRAVSCALSHTPCPRPGSDHALVPSNERCGRLAVERGDAATSEPFPRAARATASSNSLYGIKVLTGPNASTSCTACPSCIGHAASTWEEGPMATLSPTGEMDFLLPKTHPPGLDGVDLLNTSWHWRQPTHPFGHPPPAGHPQWFWPAGQRALLEPRL